jgi:hypothetical protein
MTYTPTPWHILREGDGVIAIGNKSLPHVAVVRYSHNPALSKETGKANAAHIVKCVNMHDKLVEALKRLSSATPVIIGGDRDQLDEAEEYAEIVLAEALGEASHA